MAPFACFPSIALYSEPGYDLGSVSPWPVDVRPELEKERGEIEVVLRWRCVADRGLGCALSLSPLAHERARARVPSPAQVQPEARLLLRAGRVPRQAAERAARRARASAQPAADGPADLLGRADVRPGRDRARARRRAARVQVQSQEVDALPALVRGAAANKGASGESVGAAAKLHPSLFGYRPSARRTPRLRVRVRMRARRKKIQSFQLFVGKFSFPICMSQLFSFPNDESYLPLASLLAAFCSIALVIGPSLYST